ncbi:MAG: hypothetical protein A4S08_03080 [Proteobacteria bacterium SG_bin4]|nr:MAG: hypothetical protein A4S08_03080 [Proteobacteria bacterium SG_bin4]
MNITREPELEDSDQPNVPSIVDDLTHQLNVAGIAMNDALVKATQAPASGKVNYRILIVDDNEEFLNSVVHTASVINKEQGIHIQVDPLIPENELHVREYLLQELKKGQSFDCVLLDFSFGHQQFNGLDILRTLRTDSENSPQNESKKVDEPDTGQIRLLYLPVAIVTRGGSILQNDPYFEEKVLGAGADKVYSEKGLSHSESIESEVAPSTRSLLGSLVRGGIKEMRFRAWARLWQDLRDQMEWKIKDLLDSNKWINRKNIDDALEQIYRFLSDRIKKSGYATHLSMHILDSRRKEKALLKPLNKEITKTLLWELHEIGSAINGKKTQAIPWDAIPLLKACLIEDNPAIHTHENLKEHNLLNPNYKNNPELNHYLNEFLGSHAIASRIDTKISPVGTLFMIRSKDAPPFFNEDKVHLRIIVERLGLFYRELRLRQRNHRRQMALAKLGAELLEVDNEDMIVAKAVKLLHMHLHHSRSVFTENPANNPALIGRVSIRLIEPGTGRLVRPHQPLKIPGKSHVPRWALGFDTQLEPRKISLYQPDLDTRYDELITKKKLPSFFAEPTREQIDPNRIDLTKAKMLVPIKAGHIVVGTVNVEHQKELFYGKEEKASADFALLQSVASAIGHALRSLRARRMLRKLLQLHTSVGKESQEMVIAKLMDILYDYTGCAVGIWMEPRIGGWHIGNVWECTQGYAKSDPVPTEFRTNHLQPTIRLEQWRDHILEHFDDMLIGRLVKDKKLSPDGNELVFYEDRNIFNDEEIIGIKALSKSLLALRDPDTNEVLGVFVLSFNQNPGLDIVKELKVNKKAENTKSEDTSSTPINFREKPLLEEVARFAASYLSIRRKNREYMMNQPVMEQQAALGFAYQQLRHSIKLQLGGLNGIFARIEKKLKNNSLSHEEIKKHAISLKLLQASISKNIDTSKALMKIPVPVNLDLQPVWEEICTQFSAAATKAKTHILPLSQAVQVLADKEIVKMTFTHLVDNALDELSNGNALERIIECALLPSTNPRFIQVAIRDSGQGISEDIARRLFKEIGVSSKPSGSGFGMYFSALMLERSKAHIEYDPSWKKGTQFILTFPSPALIQDKA